MKKTIKFSKEIRVGIMAVTAIFILYFGMNFLKGIDIFSRINYYYTTYEQIDRLVPSSPVYIKGYKIGQVEEIQYDFLKKTAFTVKISVSKNIRLPQGTIMELFDDGLMGGKAIQLQYTPQPNPSIFCMPNDTLPSQTVSGLPEQLVENLIPKIESITNQADSLLYSLRLLVNGKSVQNSLHAIEKTTENLAESSLQLKNIMNHDMPQLIRNVNGITDNFKEVSNNIKKIDFASTFQHVDLTIKNLNRITTRINDGAGSLGLLINDKQLYNNLLNTSNSANQLLIDLHQNPKKYVHFSLFGSGKR